MTLSDQIRCYLPLPLTVIAIDRITKNLALSYCRDGCTLNPFVSLDLAFNRGISWGMFSQAPGNLFYVVTSLVILVTAGLAIYTLRRLRACKPIWAELLVLGGSISNITDRFIHGGVVDFIVVSYGQFSWPMFNVADICIVMGVLAMIFEVYKREWNK